MICPLCKNKRVNSYVKKGEPIEEGKKWKQIFQCNDPNCSNYKKSFGERITIINNGAKEEIYY